MPASRPLVLVALEMEARALGELGADVRIIGLRGALLASVELGRPSCVIMAGLGGALGASLHVADVVIDDSGRLLGIEALKLSFASAGSIHTAAGPIGAPEQKAALYAETGAAAVDMESAIARRAAESAGLAFIGIRAISDSAAQAIDPEIFSLLDDLGRPRMAAAAALVLRRPLLMGQLMQLRTDSQRALGNLRLAVRAVLEQLNSSAAAGARPPDR